MNIMRNEMEDSKYLQQEKNALRCINRLYTAEKKISELKDPAADAQRNRLENIFNK